MKFLLDANAVISMLGSNSGVLIQIRRQAPRDVGIPVIAMHELFCGAYKSRRQAHNMALLDALQIEILEFDTEDARQAGEIRAALAAAGRPIGPYDVLIAGQARARDLVLVTHNVGEFSRVDGLRLENWQS